MSTNDTSKRTAPSDGSRAVETNRDTNASQAAKPGKKLTYKLQRELDQMEETILAEETRLEELQQDVGDPDIMADQTRFASACTELAQTQQRIRDLYDRWAELEGMSS